jgi:hypothetical protein
LLESVVARTTNVRIHHVVFPTHVVGATDVPSLMSHKLALLRERVGKSNLVDACVVTRRTAKSSNISAPNRASSSEVLAVKQMNDIAIDARASDISNKLLKQPIGVATDIVVASLVQHRSDGVRGRITMNLQGGDPQLLADSRHFVILAGSSDNALGERINIAAAASIVAERRVDDESHLNHVEGAAAFLKGAMVVIDSQIIGRINKVVDLRTTETALLTGRQEVLHPEHRELFVIRIVRGDRGIGVGVVPLEV